MSGVASSTSAAKANLARGIGDHGSARNRKPNGLKHSRDYIFISHFARLKSPLQNRPLHRFQYAGIRVL